MKEYFRLLNRSQNEFISKELGFSEEQLKEMDDESFSDIYDRICDIEVDETLNAGEGEMSERGEMAVSIVTVVGNAMAETEGLFDV